MRIKLLQLNIEQGRFIDRIIDYVTGHNFDLLHFQEVSGGKFTRGTYHQSVDVTPHDNELKRFTHYPHMDCFKVLKKNLQLNGILLPTWRLLHDNSSYIGIATFFKPEFRITDQETIWLKEYREAESMEMLDWKQSPRAALSLQFDFNDQDIRFINTHLAWGPTPEDTDYKLIQGRKLFNHIESFGEPFVLSGDFNVPRTSQTVKWLQKRGRNLIREKMVKNTLNPRTHRITSLFPKGLAVDYVFTDPKLNVVDFKLIDEADLSDHFGLSLELEV